jgi:hypothetical protein
MWCRGKNKCPRAEEKANDRLGATACSPSLDCSHDELVAYIHSMKGGERVMEMGGSCMIGKTGTVEIRDSGVCIRWDSAEYADGAGVMVTSFTGGARIIQENASAMAPATLDADFKKDAVAGCPSASCYRSSELPMNSNPTNE